MNYDMIASELMAELREQAALTQSEVAAALGVTQSTVSKFERGEMYPSLSELRAFCDVVNVTFPELAALLEARFQIRNPV